MIVIPSAHPVVLCGGSSKGGGSLFILRLAAAGGDRDTKIIHGVCSPDLEVELWLNLT